MAHAWTAAQHKKFRATRKRMMKDGTWRKPNSKPQEFPLEAIPDRGVAAVRAAPRRPATHDQRLQLAMAVTQLLLRILGE